MSSIANNSRLKKSVLAWLALLDRDTKADIIVYLTESLKTKSGKTESKKIDALFGAWKNEVSAEEMIIDVKKARTFNRERETF